MEWEFGIKPNTPKHIWWGARALYKGNFFQGKKLDTRQGAYVFELLRDRQQMIGGTEKERAKFEKWINKKGLPALRKLVKKLSIMPSEAQEILFELDGYLVVANPKKSHGYLFIGIHPIVDVNPIENTQHE
jgi:hypothetical protein